MNRYLCPAYTKEMLLAVDSGNTKIKAAVFEGSVMLGKYISDKTEPLSFFEKILKTHPGITASVLSNVGNPDADALDFLKSTTRFTEVGRQTPFPFINQYATPETLGIDRMVLSAGATLMYPAQNRLVIDAGTCITYDFTDAGNTYRGGAISPGLRLRYEAMHTFTAKLPLLSREMPGAYIGNTTVSSMHSGAVNGLLYEIEGFVSRYEKDYGSVAVILTGGDADFLAKRLKNTIFANSNFLLDSLNLLFQYITEND